MAQKGAGGRESIQEATELLCARGRRPERGRSLRLPGGVRALALNCARGSHSALLPPLSLGSDVAPARDSCQPPCLPQPGALLASCFTFSSSCSDDHFQSCYHCLKAYFESVSVGLCLPHWTVSQSRCPELVNGDPTQLPI